VSRLFLIEVDFMEGAERLIVSRTAASPEIPNLLLPPKERVRTEKNTPPSRLT